jgi:hypothetical protein
MIEWWYGGYFDFLSSASIPTRSFSFSTRIRMARGEITADRRRIPGRLERVAVNLDDGDHIARK